MVLLTIGPRRMKRNLVGTGTSVRSPRSVEVFRRMNAERGLSKKSTSPTRILEASAPRGIFLMNPTLPWNLKLRL